MAHLGGSEFYSGALYDVHYLSGLLSLARKLDGVQNDSKVEPAAWALFHDRSGAMDFDEG